MNAKLFGGFCLVLAALFTLAAVKGMVVNQFSLTLVIPAMAAIALIVVGLQHYRRSSE